MIQKKMEAVNAGILGLCVGDALGLPVQFKKREYLKTNPVSEMIPTQRLNFPKGTWSDDSSLTLCLAESLSRGYNLNDIANNFLKWFKTGFLTPDNKAIDIGNTVKEAMMKLDQGIDPIASGGNTLENNGNGSLMRILPLAFFLDSSNFDEIVKYRIIKEVSGITHSHEYSVVACYIYIDIALGLLKNLSILESYHEICKNKKKYEDLLDSNGKNLFQRILNLEINNLSEKDIISTGFVVHSLEASLWSLLTSNAYEETMIKAVNLGDDTDTTAAIAGGLAGIHYGIKNIPLRWLNDLRNVEIIESISNRFCESIYTN
ncbi:MAG: ADP-ribosylglycohydrolase family protein [Leptospiraceae bacterium]|nr:ADP-ribosylglycohydrolase family protein [Leptospiraceae bacterium]